MTTLAPSTAATLSVPVWMPGNCSAQRVERRRVAARHADLVGLELVAAEHSAEERAADVAGPEDGDGLVF